jgi:hypothetical protein
MAGNYGMPAGYAKYNTQYGGEKESVGWMLWDTVQYTSAATVALTFFNAIRATRDLSNMELAGQLAAPKAFLVRAIRFYVKELPRATARSAAASVQTGALDDMQQLLNDGVLSFLIGSKNYGVFPLWSVPAGGGFFGQYGSDGDVADPGEVQDWATNGVPHTHNVFTLSRPLFIAPQINFQVTITWPAAITLAGGNTNLSVILDGDLIRPVQ